MPYSHILTLVNLDQLIHKIKVNLKLFKKVELEHISENEWKITLKRKDYTSISNLHFKGLKIPEQFPIKVNVLRYDHDKTNRPHGDLFGILVRHAIYMEQNYKKKKKERATHFPNRSPYAQPKL